MLRRSLFSHLVVVVLSLILAACAGGGSDAPPLPAQTVDSGGYRLGPGDKVSVTVFGQDQLSGEFTVDGTGTIAMPLVGEIKAAGLGVRDLEQAIARRLAGDYVRDPRVSVAVSTFRPFYVMGEVTRPGQYAYTDGLTVAQAVAMAGGYTYRARQDYALVFRGETEKKQYRAPPTARVLPDDVINVPERLF